MIIFRFRAKYFKIIDTFEMKIVCSIRNHDVQMHILTAFFYNKTLLGFRPVITKSARQDNI